MIGTIRRFGSIVVNDLRIAYPDDVSVRIDGAPARAADLKLGQVVRVVAHGGAGGLATRRIDVASEVVGPVESVAQGGLTVLGQRVATAGLAGRWAVGDRVAVSGLRWPDGVVVASLVEPREPGPARVAGPVRRGPGGHPMIGGLRLEGADALPVGRHAAVSGEASGGVLKVARAREALPFPPGLARVSVEAYVGRRGGRLTLGSGLDVTGPAGAAVPRRGSVRAVLTMRPAADGRLTLEALRLDERGTAERRAPLFERAPDRIDARGLPGRGPDGVLDRDGRGPGNGGPGNGGPGGFGIDTRTGPGGVGGGHGGPRRLRRLGRCRPRRVRGSGGRAWRVRRAGRCAGRRLRPPALRRAVKRSFTDPALPIAPCRWDATCLRSRTTRPAPRRIPRTSTA